MRSEESVPKTTPNNLRPHLTSFIGRKQELVEISRLLSDPASPSRLLTLTGPGGVGKTRLALEAGASLLDNFEDGVWLVELASLSDPEPVLSVIAQLWGLKEDPERPLLDTLLDFLRPKRLLLILDNCEHLIEACATLAEELLRGCPALSILATSREELRIGGETVFQVPPLSLPSGDTPLTLESLTQSEAGQLFVARARSACADFALSGQNLAAVAQICERLDGLPLALELSAARLRGLPVGQLAVRLENCLPLLATGSRTALPRHQTMQALIDWSYNLLSEREQVVLRRLAGFAGSFSPEAAEFCCAGEYRVEDGWGKLESAEVLDLLLQLVSKSLVQREESSSAISEARYYLLETIRQYSRQRLAEAGEAEGVAERLSDWCLVLAEEAGPKLQGPEQILWLNRLEREHNNIRAALSWALNHPEAKEKALRLCGALWRFWQAHSHFKEGWRWLKLALDNAGSVSPEVRAKALHGAGVLLSISDYKTSLELHQENLRLRQQLEDVPGQVVALNDLGWLALHYNDFNRANQFGEASLELNRKLGDKRHIAASLMVLAVVALKLGEVSRAALLTEECIQIWEELGDQGSIASALNQLGMIAARHGDYPGASEYLLRGLRLNREMGGAIVLANALLHISELAVMQKRQPEGFHLATRLSGTLEHLNQATGMSMPPLARNVFETALSKARNILDREIFEKLWAEGEALTLSQAVTLAEEVLAGWVQATAGPDPGASSVASLNQDTLDELTAREAEVLRLVAIGLTNAQVAEELSVTPRTINAHLTSIYAKLGVTSRSGAIRYALEHHLA